MARLLRFDTLRDPLRASSDRRVPMTGFEGTPLPGIDGWTPAYVDALAQLWITTAEQVVGLAATPQGISSLAKQLGVSDTEAQRLVGLARAALPAAAAAQLSEEVDTSQHGLGALPPDSPPKPHGRRGSH